MNIVKVFAVFFVILLILFMIFYNNNSKRYRKIGYMFAVSSAIFFFLFLSMIWANSINPNYIQENVS